MVDNTTSPPQMETELANRANLLRYVLRRSRRPPPGRRRWDRLGAAALPGVPLVVAAAACDPAGSSAIGRTSTHTWASRPCQTTGMYPFLHFSAGVAAAGTMAGGGRLEPSLLLPAWPDDPRLWFVLILGTVFVLFETGNLALLYRISTRLYAAKATGRASSSPVLRPVWLYALLFVPLYAVLGFFELGGAVLPAART